MDDEEMLFQQVQMTTTATPGSSAWVYRCSVYAYPWYTSVRTILDDPAYASWFIKCALGLAIAGLGAALSLDSAAGGTRLPSRLPRGSAAGGTRLPSR